MTRINKSMKAFRRSVIGTLLSVSMLVGMFASPAAAASAIQPCFNYVTANGWQASLEAGLFDNGPTAIAVAQVWGHRSTQSCSTPNTSMVVEVAAIQYRNTTTLCDLDYGVATGSEVLFTSCTNSSEDRFKYSGRGWITGTPYDSGTYTLALSA